MGSQSDWPTMRHAAETLEALGVPFEARIVSAHRTPERMMAYASAAKGRGLKVIIAGAGGAAHLPGMSAALTPLPVLGVPVESAALKGMDSLLSIVQMPAGIPVGTLAIGRAGAVNAALLAASIVGLGDAKIMARAGALAGPPDRAPWPARPRTRRPPLTARNESRETLPPGSTIGILGGGQLGRMTALAAARLGYRCIVYAPEDHSIARRRRGRPSRAAPTTTTAALARFAGPGRRHHLRVRERARGGRHRMPALKPVRPGVKAIHVAQHRLREKEFFRKLGIGTADYQPIASEADIAAATALPGILKTCTEGYDGKGQVRVADRAGLAAAWQKLGKRDCILEALVDFLCEISVIVARGLDGATRTFPIGLNDHRDGILRTTTVPSGLPAGTLSTAERFGTELARGLDLVGLVALEMFVTRDGRVLANEMAPTAAQFRPLDDRRLRDQPVRAAGARDLRPAAGAGRRAGAVAHGKPDRRGSQRLAALSRRPDGAAASLRQDRAAARPQDGSRHLLEAVLAVPPVHDFTCDFSFSIFITSSMRRSRKPQVASLPGERSFSQ